MCTYARTVFDCKHEVWGRKVKSCTIGEDYQQGTLPRDCAFRKPHGLQSKKLTRRCDKCIKLDKNLSDIRKKLEECRSSFRQKWPNYVGKKDEPRGTNAECTLDGRITDSQEGVGGFADQRGWIYAEDGEITAYRRLSFGGLEPIEEENDQAGSGAEANASRSCSLESKAATRRDITDDDHDDEGGSLPSKDCEYCITREAEFRRQAHLSSSIENPKKPELSATKVQVSQTPKTYNMGTENMKQKTPPKPLLPLPVSGAPRQRLQ